MPATAVGSAGMPTSTPALRSSPVCTPAPAVPASSVVLPPTWLAGTLGKFSPPCDPGHPRAAPDAYTSPTRDLTPGEFSDKSDAKYNSCQNERTYVTTFGAALRSAGMPNHAIVDTGRNAVQGLREEWGNWCNVDGAGFGTRPTADTGLELADAFVWVKVSHPGPDTLVLREGLLTRFPNSLVVRATARATALRSVTTRSAASPMPSSPRPRPASGTRPTLRCSSRTPTRRSKRLEVADLWFCLFGLVWSRKQAKLLLLLMLLLLLLLLPGLRSAGDKAKESGAKRTRGRTCSAFPACLTYLPTVSALG